MRMSAVGKAEQPLKEGSELLPTRCRTLSSCVTAQETPLGSGSLLPRSSLHSCIGTTRRGLSRVSWSWFCDCRGWEDRSAFASIETPDNSQRNRRLVYSSNPERRARTQPWPKPTFFKQGGSFALLATSLVTSYISKGSKCRAKLPYAQLTDDSAPARRFPPV